MCSYRQSFNGDVNLYPYYDIFDECCARLNAMIETLHEIDPSLLSPRLKASLYDDFEFSLPLRA